MQETAELIVHTLDDSLPEQDESVFVRLTRVRFIQDGRFSPGKLVVCEIDQGQIHTGREVLTR